MPAASRITMVRMKVAKSELTFSMPILAKIAVSAAKPADSSAQNGQVSMTFFMGAFCQNWHFGKASILAIHRELSTSDHDRFCNHFEELLSIVGAPLSSMTQRLCFV